jgi:hypothetical protein
MPTHQSSNKSQPTTRRRPRLTATIGLLVGATAGVALVLLSAAAGAHSGADEARALLDATHLPPLLTSRGEPVELRYDIYCVSAGDDQNDRTCETGGKVFVRPGDRGPFRQLPLHIDESAVEGRFVAVVPNTIAHAAEGFTYYAVLESKAAGMTVTLPAGGASAPQRSLPLDDAVEVSIGTHTFGAARKADTRVLEASWGDGFAQVGLESGRNLPPIGGSSFDVDERRTVHVLDQVHRRVLRWRAGGSGPVSVPLVIDGTLADLAVASDGTAYVLESAREGIGPVLRTFGPAGERRGTVDVGERTASQVRVGHRGPIVLQHPSGQWMPMTMDGGALSASSQTTGGRPGRSLPRGGEVVVLRRSDEVRVLASNANDVRRSWRVTSATPVGEVQLAEPVGNRLLLVLRLYTDDRDEFVALVLGPNGLVSKMSIASADWAETAPLSRFRLVGSSLYQLGSTPAGVFVDRYDLEMN